jgi:hypothetical protein
LPQNNQAPLAADIVVWGSTNGAAWADKYAEVNHGALPEVDVQHIVFVDGHVEAETEFYRQNLLAIKSNYQYNRFASGAQFILWFWGKGY